MAYAICDRPCHRDTHTQTKSKYREEREREIEREGWVGQQERDKWQEGAVLITNHYAVCDTDRKGNPRV